MNTPELQTRYADLRAVDPTLHARDFAARLDVTEAELVAASCGVVKATRLGGDLASILGEITPLGDVKTMTRNATAVLERRGTFGAAELDGHVGQVVGADIDLRIFPRQFGSAFAVEELGKHGARRSIQLFDVHGDSVHKVYLEDASKVGALDALIARRAAADFGPLEVAARAAEAPVTPDAEIDVAGLREGWDAMQDTHAFFGLLCRFGVARTQALRLASEERARVVEPSVSLALALSRAASTETSIMIFVPSRGVIQIHTGRIINVRSVDAWLNVLDPRMNLHVRRDGLATAWVVRKPTSDGVVTSLELYDATNQTILYMFGERKPGRPESPSWRQITADLPTLGSV